MRSWTFNIECAIRWATSSRESSKRSASTTPRSNCAATDSRCSNSTKNRAAACCSSPHLQARNHLYHQPIGRDGRYRHHALRGPGRNSQTGKESDAAPRAARLEIVGRRGRRFLQRAWPATPNCSTRPMSPWSGPAKPPARSARCSTGSPNYLRKELETRGKVRSALAYPAVMLVVAIAVTFFLLIYVLPQVHALVQPPGDQACPTSTVVMMHVSSMLIHHWPWFVVGDDCRDRRIGVRHAHAARHAGMGLVQNQHSDHRADGPQRWRSAAAFARSARWSPPACRCSMRCGFAPKCRTIIYYEQLWLHVLEQVTSRQADLRRPGRQSAVSADAGADDLDRRGNRQTG